MSSLAWHEPIWLASTSPRRAELLRQIAVAFDVLAPEDGEDAESLEVALANESPRAYVARVCGLKLEAARARLKRLGWQPRPILVADTTVSVDAQILGKPVDAAQATAMLQRLQGRTHEVLSGVALGEASAANQASAARSFYRLQVSQVGFAPLDEATMQAYVASGEPFGKAGGYAIQGRAAAFVEHLEGSYSGVMGLPLFDTSLLLKALQR